MKKPMIAAVLGASLLTGCAAPGYYPDGSAGGFGSYGQKQTAGAVLGGVAGGLAGSRFGGGTGKLAMVGLGTLLGAYLGSEAGASLDRADLAYADQAASRAYGAPVGSTIRWNNPGTGNYGSYTPMRDGYSASGDYCREFESTITIQGRREQGVGTACRQPDGSWRIVS